MATQVTPTGKSTQELKKNTSKVAPSTSSSTRDARMHAAWVVNWRRVEARRNGAAAASLEGR